MNRQALLLNQDYRPLTVCSVQRAFLLVYLQKAELISQAANEALRSINASYPLPSVIRLNRYIHLPFKGVILNKENIFRRDGYECQYCGGSRDLTLDHLLPKARGGQSTWLNLVTACRACNNRKGDFTPEEAGMTVRRQPYKPSFILFLRHFSAVREEWIPFLGG